MTITERLALIKDSSIFQIVVTIVILLSSVIVGIGTYDFTNSLFLKSLAAMDLSITVFFVIEILIRFFAEKRKVDFFKDGWNIFDTVIVVSSLIPTAGLLLMQLYREIQKMLVQAPVRAGLI